MEDWKTIFITVFGAMFSATLLTVALFVRHPTPFQIFVFRTLLALSAGGIAATIPGFLNVSMSATGIGVSAGGALAVFALVYRVNPIPVPDTDSGSRNASGGPLGREDRPERTPSEHFPEIENLEQLISVISGLSANQKNLLAIIAKHKHGIHAGDLAMQAGGSRSDVVYRGRDLSRDGLIRISNLTDYQFELSDSVKKLIGLHSEIVTALLVPSKGA